MKYIFDIQEDGEAQLVTNLSGIDDLLFSRENNYILYDGDVYDYNFWDGTKIIEDQNRLAEEQYLAWKEQREISVDEIIITTSTGNQFDGHEMAQGRMARAVILMDDVMEIGWILADNSVAMITKAELLEALYLSGQEQSRLWTLDKPTV